MKLIKGDILSDINPKRMTIILHGCNCQNIMGGGIARYLRDKFPSIYEADSKTIVGDDTKLGTYSYSRVRQNLFVFNLYTQFDIVSERDVDYDALYRSLLGIKTLMDEYGDKDAEIRSPQIGCGLAGGEWSIVEKMYDFLLPQANIYFI